MLHIERLHHHPIPYLKLSPEHHAESALALEYYVMIIAPQHSASDELKALWAQYIRQAPQVTSLTCSGSHRRGPFMLRSSIESQTALGNIPHVLRSIVQVV